MSGKDLKRTGNQGSSTVPLKVDLGPTTSMDLSWLPEDERIALLKDYAKGMMDLGVKAQELNVDAAALKKTMDNMSDTVKDVSASGDAVTVTHTQKSKVGRTEVMMGNTEHAQTGKLSKSQSGEKDWTPYYIFGGLLALILIFATNN
ncbi:hypothetical protein OAS86_06990 [Gammaproteobacteria bacterium]|nr:hypothetical protein [Gammaproteobacteria bacterium]